MNIRVKTPLVNYYQINNITYSTFKIKKCLKSSHLYRRKGESRMENYKINMVDHNERVTLSAGQNRNSKYSKIKRFYLFLNFI